MFDFLKRTPGPDARELEALINDLAESKAEKDFQLLHHLMAGRQVFVPADLGSLQAGDTSPSNPVVSSFDQLQMRSIKLRNKMLAAVAATSSDSRILRDGYVDMEWIEFLKMTAALNATYYGALLHGKTSWVAFDRERIDYLITLGN